MEKASVIVIGVTEETAHYRLFVIEEAIVVYKEECYLDEEDYSDTPVLQNIRQLGTKEYGNYWHSALVNNSIIFNAVTTVHPEFNPINIIMM